MLCDLEAELRVARSKAYRSRQLWSSNVKLCPYSVYNYYVCMDSMSLVEFVCWAVQQPDSVCACPLTENVT